MEPLRNKVAESEIVVFNLEDLWEGRDVVEIDLAEFLAEGLVLREKEFRTLVKEHDWSQYRDKLVGIICSTDAIVPTWAFMLLASKLKGVASSACVGSREQVVRDHFATALEKADWEEYRDAIVVVKGCGSAVVPDNAFMTASAKLQQVARKIMYGEPCSSVPIWRRSSATTGTKSGSAVPVSLPGRKG